MTVNNAVGNELLDVGSNPTGSTDNKQAALPEGGARLYNTEFSKNKDLLKCCLLPTSLSLPFGRRTWLTRRTITSGRKAARTLSDFLFQISC